MSEDQKNKYMVSLQKESQSEANKNKGKPGFCPNCGAYVGAFTRCSVCRAKMPHSTKLKIIQIASILGVIFGLVMIGIYAQQDPAPNVSIADIGRTYSNANISIEGKITDVGFYQADDFSWRMLILTVSDVVGWGSIEVKIFTETVDELIQTRNIPVVGDYCEIRGSIYIKGSDMYLNLESSSYLKLYRITEFPTNGEPINAIEFYDVYEEHIGERVYVNGTVEYVNSEYFFFYINTNHTNDLRVSISDYVRLFSPWISLNVIAGEIVEVKGTLGEYAEGIPEILPSSENDIKIVGWED
ncbi:MAG: hypothetical protein BAJALOKI1v1_620005 [Promethearchaeota archaeon]|nr:MAG: hypothetical protein BAJALOKI1v1_620005 [Candidatus Lokiarchaeota archaeon]